MRFKSVEERYWYHLRKEREMLDDFTGTERDAAETLLLSYKLQKRDVPDDIYRAVCFFMNAEYKTKPKALVELYFADQKLIAELREASKERALDLLCYRYQVYGAILLQEGY
jgi:hypothetical protein